MKQKIKFLMGIATLVLVVASCKPTPEPEYNAYASGVFVMNEGAFTGGSGTITHYKSDSSKLTQNIFEKQNNRPMGNIGQSFTFANGKGYLVANGANKVEIVDNNFKSVGTIVDMRIAQPRYIISVGSKLYMSQWGTDGLSGKVLVIDTNTNAITKVIDNVGAGCENMLNVGDKIYVANSGGFGTDSTVAVIDITTNTVIKKINMGYNVNSILKDKNDKVYALYSGKNDFTNPTLSTKGGIARINTTTDLVENDVQMPNNSFHPAKMVYFGSQNVFYFLSDLYGGEVYSFAPVGNVLTTTAVVSGRFLALGANDITSKLYAAKGSFTSNGTAYSYNISSRALVDSFAVGLIPGFFGFK